LLIAKFKGIIMELILLVKVAKLGSAGEVVTVKPGYGRNFLLPQGKALRATEANKKVYDQKRKELELINAEKIEEAKKLLPLIENKYIVLVRQAGEDGRLFGSASPKDIAEEVSKLVKQDISRNQIHLAKPIKFVGIYDTEVELHPEVVVKFVVNVSRTAGEAAEAERKAKLSTKKEEAEEVVVEAVISESEEDSSEL
jgi:large subunit ribosomal protein L9